MSFKVERTGRILSPVIAHLYFAYTNWIKNTSTAHDSGLDIAKVFVIGREKRLREKFILRTRKLTPLISSLTKHILSCYANKQWMKNRCVVFFWPRPSHNLQKFFQRFLLIVLFCTSKNFVCRASWASRLNYLTCQASIFIGYKYYKCHIIFFIKCYYSILHYKKMLLLKTYAGETWL